MSSLPPGLEKTVQECHDLVTKQRDSLLPFYDGRVIFACYQEVVSSLAASLMHTKIYEPQVVAALMAENITDAMLRESKTIVKHVAGAEVIEGGKQ